MTTRFNRRGLLGLGAGLSLGALLPSIQRARAIGARRDSGTIEDVQHIVVLMQENRSFDHYLGHLSGVRGYNDRQVVNAPEGHPIWWQQRQRATDGRIVPFRLPTQTSSAQCVMDLDHSWTPTHAAINKGWNDQWPRQKTNMTMGYYTRADIPFHYALADAFTVCDHYFCSTPTQTHPNRLYLMTGMVDPTGAGGGPVLDNVDWVDRDYYPKVPAPFTWTTYPERLQQAGISWQVYQQGLTGGDAENGNFGTNMLMNFRNFVDAKPGTPLHERAMTVRNLDALRKDVLTDRLPQVSWILPPAAYSEHPRWTPGYGATFIAHALDALTANPEVWARTVFLVTYDENDGYFDHMVPPQPPTRVLPGASTVRTDGEIHDRITASEPHKFSADHLPYGLGPRVPTFAISPWSTGGFVCSEVFDHTSILRFMEARFGVAEPNITPWRRTVCGDLTSAFDFSRKRRRSVPLPDTNTYRRIADAECKLPKPAIPSHSTLADMGRQEPDFRPARPLPYVLAADLTHGDALSCTLRLRNHGHAGACFYVYRENTSELPRRYTLEPGKSLTDRWSFHDGKPIELRVIGPNGFARVFRRNGAPRFTVTARHHSGGLSLSLSVPVPSADARHPAPLPLTIRDTAYGAPDREMTLQPGQSSTIMLDLGPSHRWYDFTIDSPHDPETSVRLAGHVENGQPGITDPAMATPHSAPPHPEAP